MSVVHNLLIMGGKFSGPSLLSGLRMAFISKLGAKATWNWVGILNLSAFSSRGAICPLTMNKNEVDEKELKMLTKGQV
jgi:hypothetical protein